MPLPCLHIYATLLEIHFNLNKYQLQSDIHGYGTRAANEIRIPWHRLTVCQKNSINIGLYNVLPVVFKNLDYKHFKFAIKAYLLKNCFYSIKEFLESFL